VDRKIPSKYPALCSSMYSYLDDSMKVTTSSVLDEEGYFHTGDIAHMEGDDFVMDGRLGTDC
jgi:malonyl-CoA/methylmalonyl-CoA synthetase